MHCYVRCDHLRTPNRYGAEVGALSATQPLDQRIEPERAGGRSGKSQRLTNRGVIGDGLEP